DERLVGRIVHVHALPAVGFDPLSVDEATVAKKLRVLQWGNGPAGLDDGGVHGVSPVRNEAEAARFNYSSGIVASSSRGDPSMRRIFMAATLAVALAAPLTEAKTLRWSSQGDYLTADPMAQNELLTNSIN